MQRVWAWLIAGMIAYIPANLYPIMTTRMLSDETEATIIGGAVELISHGAWFVGGIVLLASVVVPMVKFAIIIFLALSVRYGWTFDRHQRLHLYELIEYIGRWSMIDVFVVAILVSLIRFGVLASVEPGPAAAAFGVSVVCTMIAAQQFDARLIWDGDEHG